MTTVKNAVRFVLALIALLAAQMAAGLVIHVSNPLPPNFAPWYALASVITVAVLSVAAVRSDWRDWRLARAMFFIPMAIATVNFIEGALFLPNAHMDWRSLFALTLLTYVLAALLWFLIFRSAVIPAADVEAALPSRSFGQMAWRFVACSALYVFLYFLAGMIIFPYVSDFYATQRVPGPAEIVSLQFFLRGPVFILVCLTLLRMFRMSRFAGALAVGAAFTLVSGVAPLIVPSSVFPDAVRWVHFGEVTSSNLVFGFVVGWIWGHAKPVRQLQHAHA